MLLEALLRRISLVMRALKTRGEEALVGEVTEEKEKDNSCVQNAGPLSLDIPPFPVREEIT